MSKDKLRWPFGYEILTKLTYPPHYPYTSGIAEAGRSIPEFAAGPMTALAPDGNP